MRFVATVAPGLEATAAEEIRALGLRVLAAGGGAVAFQGREEDGQRACLFLRSARRVLLPVAEYEADGPEALYEGALAVAWEDHLDLSRTFAVEASVQDAPTGHSGFAALKVKDAVADRLRRRLGGRPDVDRRDPDLRILVRWRGSRVELSLDLSGGPLHKRGYRLHSVQAPLNETTAAGILLLLGYDGTVPFSDPFCGSGTFAVEAALIATGTAPGLLRDRPFGFERWPAFRPGRFARLKEEAARRVTRPACRIAASDRDGAAVEAARRNARRAGMEEWIAFATADAREWVPPGKDGILATNPPYGDHAGAGEDLPSLYRSFGDALKRRGAGWTAGILCGNPALLKSVGLRPSRRIPLWNGPQECRLAVYRLVEGTFRGRPAPASSPP
ncbi:MAG: THUMP domain-containing class I SAM-dependent RNA methyltransferase [Acidobacteriota bacterium]